MAPDRAAQGWQEAAFFVDSPTCPLARSQMRLYSFPAMFYMDDPSHLAKGRKKESRISTRARFVGQRDIFLRPLPHPP